MNTIPTQKVSQLFRGEIAQMRYISANEKPSTAHAHRDDYYIFLLIEKGKETVIIDFEEHEIMENNVYCILPGQVHFSGGSIHVQCWFLALDSMLVKTEYKEIFEKAAISGYNSQPDKSTIIDLCNYAPILHKQIQANKDNIGYQILHDLLSGYIGMIAGIYQKGLSPSENKRSAIITYQFKSLLSANYRSMKRPSEYAAKMNISSVYLYEAVKQATGQSVTNLIHNEVIIQAKRLLYYTNMSAKEIALDLGYEDYAYFSRLFSRITKMSPKQFRKKYIE